MTPLHQDTYADLPEHTWTRLRCMGCMHFIDIPVYCGDRFCPICSVPRLARIRDRLRNLIAGVSLVPGETIKHLTLTIANQTNLYTMISFLIASFRRLRSTKFWKNHVSGGCYVIEITTGSNGSFHAHLHCIIQAKFLPHPTLVLRWKKASKGSTGVFITVIPLKAVVAYLTKYLTKQCSVADPDTRYEIGRLLGQIRLFQPFGSWHGIKSVLKRPPYQCPNCGLVGNWAVDQIHNGLPVGCHVEGMYRMMGFEKW